MSRFGRPPMDDYRHLVGTTGPIPDKKCLRVNEESDVWAHYNCRCVRREDDGKGDAHTVIAQSTDEMLATLGSGDYSWLQPVSSFHSR